MFRTVSNNKNKSNISFSQGGPLNKAIRRVAVESLKYGPNGDYYKGDILFTNDNSLKAKGIYHFTRWERKSGIKVAHVAIVADALTCFEAKKGGIKKTELKKYFGNNKFRLFIRRPAGMTEEISNELIKREENSVGKTKFAFGLMFLSLIRGSLGGHLIDKATGNKLFDKLFVFASRTRHFLCSHNQADNLKTVAKMRRELPLAHGPIIGRPSAAITPQRLFETDELFEPTVVQIR